MLETLGITFFTLGIVSSALSIIANFKVFKHNKAAGASYAASLKAEQLRIELYGKYLEKANSAKVS